MYRLDRTELARLLADEDALATLRSYPIEEIWQRIERPEDCEDEGEAFTLLMGVMYDLRPVGYV